MNWTRPKTLVGVVVLLLVVAALVIKEVFFPPVKNAYFAMDYRSLLQAPAGLIILRPTHFPFLRDEGILSVSPSRKGAQGQWIMGRNAPLGDVLAVAYDQDVSRVVMPSDATEGRFDFLVTTADNQRQQLQQLIGRNPGYMAQTETRGTQVLALKVVNVQLPGLAASGEDEQPNINFLDAKLQFTHLPVSVLADTLDRFFRIPVVDETGLTNFYDFSIPWSSETQSRMLNGEISQTALGKMLAGLGLGLKPDTVSLKMLVVTKASALRSADGKSPVQVVSAVYGEYTNFADVTHRVRDLLHQNTSFEVHPGFLEADPFVGYNKVLVIVYDVKGQRRIFTAFEGDTVSILTLLQAAGQ